MSLIIILIIAILGFWSITDVSTVEVEPASIIERPAESWVVVTTDGIEGVIVPPDQAAGLWVTAPYWQPDVASITRAEEAIEAEQGELSHYRQYVGYTVDGQRMIFINGFCESPGDWRSQPVFVLDGGDCYFGATFNVETGELTSFSFNGEA